MSATKNVIICGVNCACAPQQAAPAATSTAKRGAGCSEHAGCSYAKEGKCACAEGKCAASQAKQTCSKAISVSGSLIGGERGEQAEERARVESERHRATAQRDGG